MNVNDYVNMLGPYLKRRFNTRVRKLTLHGSFSCPNRDGTLGRGGCTFCNVESFVDETAKEVGIQQQLHQRKEEMVRKAGYYLAYFQAYTSTYGEVQQLQALYEDALAGNDVIGLCVGTRPDCVPDEVLQLLARYQEQGQEIWLELGLQSAHDETLKRINRGHGFAAYQDTVKRAQALGLAVCTHLIVGLPCEDMQANLDTIDRVVELGVEGIKLHPLHIVEGSTMGKAWHAGRQEAPEFEFYCETAAEMIRRTPADVVFHRISASARPPTLLAPKWCENRWIAPQRIAELLAERGRQGSAIA